MSPQFSSPCYGKQELKAKLTQPLYKKEGMLKCNAVICSSLFGVACYMDLELLKHCYSIFDKEDYFILMTAWNVKDSLSKNSIIIFQPSPRCDQNLFQRFLLHKLTIFQHPLDCQKISSM
uniref:Uncharacterized protein n=1 Tax=Kalanchoe fedtschenkoi TaxID=63787 RepID=A0A7N0TM87_KALFE